MWELLKFKNLPQAIINHGALRFAWSLPNGAAAKTELLQPYTMLMGKIN